MSSVSDIPLYLVGIFTGLGIEEYTQKSLIEERNPQKKVIAIAKVLFTFMAISHFLNHPSVNITYRYAQGIWIGIAISLIMRSIQRHRDDPELGLAAN